MAFIGGHTSDVIHDADMSTVCDVDTKSLLVKDFMMSVLLRNKQTNLNVSYGVSLKLYQD